MKKLFSLSFIFLLAAAGCTRKDIVEYPKPQPTPITIPDPVFRNYCLTAKDMEGNLRIDLDGNGEITGVEASLVEEIHLDNEGGDIVGRDGNAGVRSLEGIGHFTGLRRLSVGNNSLETLDLSNNRHLTYIDCSDNKITTFYIASWNQIETLNCNGNAINSLNVSAMPSLKYLYCTRNRLSALDVSGNPALVELSCDRNQLTALDVSTCDAMTDLTCAGNGLASLTLPENSALVRLDCGTHEYNEVSRANDLKELDLSGQEKLSLLRVNANPLASLDISECATLRTLECVGCQLSSLDITHNARLRLLFCNENRAGMTITVPAGFNSGNMLAWVIGTATVTEAP